MLNFSEALTMIKSGARMARSGWNGKGIWVEIQVPDAMSKMSLPYIFIRTVDGHRVPWLASQTDMLAGDWHQFRAPSVNEASCEQPMTTTEVRERSRGV